MKKFIPIIILIAFISLGLAGIVFLSQANKEENKYRDSDNLILLTGAEFKEKIENKDSFILLVMRDGCHYCEEFDPIFKSVLEENNVTAYAINTAKLKEEEKAYFKNVSSVTSTPTTVFIVDGEEPTTLNRIVGKVSKARVTDRLKDLGYIK